MHVDLYCVLFVVIVAYVLNTGHTVNYSCTKVVFEQLFKVMKLNIFNFKDAEAIAAYMLCDCVLHFMYCVVLFVWYAYTCNLIRLLICLL